MGAPTTVACWGANGTHWAKYLPTAWPGDWSTCPNQISAACSWAAIAAAVASVTKAQADAGVLIRVAPGVLTGKGGGSSSTPVLQALGSTTWAQRITIFPQDGFGSITVTGGARFHQLYGINLCGFVFDDVCFSGCTNSMFSRWVATGHAQYNSDSAASGKITENVEFVEYVVGLTAETSDTDRSNFSCMGGEARLFRWAGGYVVPRYRLPKFDAGGNYTTAGLAHMDTFQIGQLSGYDDGIYYHDFEYEDTIHFAADNSAWQTGSVNGLTWTNCAAITYPLAQTRYPFSAGSNALLYAPTTSGQCFANGGGHNYKAYGSVFMGNDLINHTINATYPYPGRFPQPWADVSNTTVTSEFTANCVPISGSFTIDDTIVSRITLPPVHDMAYLMSIWGSFGGGSGGSAVAPTCVPVSTSAACVVGSSVTLSVATTGTAPIVVQWYKNGTIISGKTGLSLTIASPVVGDSGSYTATATNFAGSATSSAITLTVTAGAVAPTITSNPVGGVAKTGSNFTMSVTATGTAPLSYQWFQNGAPLAGQTLPTLILTPITSDNSGVYSCNVTNAAGSASSTGAELSVEVVAPPTYASGALIAGPDGKFVQAGGKIVGR